MAESKEKGKLQKPATNNGQPDDARVMAAILKDMGVLEYEPRVINQMLDFTYRYVTNVLDDAKAYSNHASKNGIDVDDVKLAIQLHQEHSFTTPPSLDLLEKVALDVNSTRLPDIKPYIGHKLPHARYCLSSTNYKLKSIQEKSMEAHLQNSGPRLAINSVPELSGSPGRDVEHNPSSEHHQKGEKPYYCETSGESFNRKGDLDRHKLIHTGEKPYYCETCGESFNGKGDLDRHKLIHTGEKPYICKTCGVSFRRKGHLDSHKLIHTGEKPYTCKTCGRGFTQKGNLSVHSRIHRDK